MDHLIWDIMEQTWDCLHCGSRLDFQAYTVNESIDLLSYIHDWWKEDHKDCTQNGKGKALEEYRDWFRKESTVSFKATPEQLFKFVSSTGVEISFEDFQELKSFTFETPLSRLEIHKDKEDDHYFIYRQRWSPTTREALWDAVINSGADILSERSFKPMPEHLKVYGFHEPTEVYRKPKRVWR